MMLLAIAAAVTATGVTDLPAHETAIEHRGSAYSLSYHPNVETRMKTIGVATGARMSMERCRRTVTVHVERRIARRDESTAHATILPDATRTFSDERHGACATQARVMTNAPVRAEAVRDHVAAVAARDRGQAIAQIDAAYSLAQE